MSRLEVTSTLYFCFSLSTEHNNVACPTTASVQEPCSSSLQLTPRKKTKRRQKRKGKKKVEKRKEKQRHRRRMPSGVPEQESGCPVAPILVRTLRSRLVTCISFHLMFGLISHALPLTRRWSQLCEVEVTSVLCAAAALKAQKSKIVGLLSIVHKSTAQVPTARHWSGGNRSASPPAPCPLFIPTGRTATQTASAVREITPWPLLASGAASVRGTHATQRHSSKMLRGT